MNSLLATDNVLIRASQFISISGDFYVPVGASFYADADKSCPTDIATTNCTETFNPCVYDFSNYTNSVKKNIVLGDNGCNASVMPVNNNVIFQATDQIVFKLGNIKPASNTSITLKIVPCQ